MNEDSFPGPSVSVEGREQTTLKPIQHYKCEEMSGGVEMERICSGELSIAGISMVMEQQEHITQSQICSGGGGVNNQKQAVLNNLISTNTTKANLSSANNLPKQINNVVMGGSPVKNQNGNNNNKKQHRRLRRQHQAAHRKQNHFHHAKRIRRNTQPAPNNTNEFLMQEHDHLFHLDFEHEEWEGQQQQQQQDLLILDPNNLSTTTQHYHKHHPPHQSNGGGSGAFYSSSEDDQDYLSREFSATYDTVNAERLSSMTKAELISEYQMLQERVETLERRLKTANEYNYNSKNEVVQVQQVPNTAETSPSSSDSGGTSLLGKEPMRVVKGVRDEIQMLREETDQIKQDSTYIQRLVLNEAQGNKEEEEEEEMEAEQASTDSGGNNNNSGSVVG